MPIEQGAEAPCSHTSFTPCTCEVESIIQITGYPCFLLLPLGEGRDGASTLQFQLFQQFNISFNSGQNFTFQNVFIGGVGAGRVAGTHFY